MPAVAPQLFPANDKRTSSCYAHLYELDLLLFYGNQGLDLIQDYGHSKVNLAFVRQGKGLSPVPRWIRWVRRGTEGTKPGQTWFVANIEQGSNKRGPPQSRLNRVALDRRWAAAYRHVQLMHEALEDRRRFAALLRQCAIDEWNLQRRAEALLATHAKELPEDSPVTASDLASAPQRRADPTVSDRIRAAQEAVFNIELILQRESRRLAVVQGSATETIALMFAQRGKAKQPVWIAYRNGKGTALTAAVMQNQRLADFGDRRSIGSHWSDYLATLRRMTRVMRSRSDILNRIRDHHIALVNLSRQIEAATQRHSSRQTTSTRRLDVVCRRYPSTRGGSVAVGEVDAFSQQ